MVQDALKISSVGALGVELWPFYCEIRILVPMSYIVVWEHNQCKFFNVVDVWSRFGVWFRTALEKQIPFNPRLRKQKFTNKIALNRVLTLADCRSRRPLSESVFRSQKAPLGVELWSFYCKKRISVPMSYITFLQSSICLQNVCFPHKLINYWSRMCAFRIS